MSPKSLLCAASLLIAIQAPASAEVLITDYFSNADWSLYEQTDDGLFSQCLAKKAAEQDKTRLQIGRNIWGDDFLLVYGINKLIAKDQTEGKGRLLIDGKEAYDYSGMYIYDSAVEQDTKYITIFLARDFMPKLAAASSLTIEFAKGKVKHSLKGSEEIIDRLDPCMDQALSKEGEAPPTLPAGTTVMDIDNIAGAYQVRGRNPNGKYYYGTGDVSYLPGLLQVNWRWSDKTEAKGTITTTGNVAITAVEGLDAPAIYTIGRDGVWRGTWSNGQGIEIMVPQRK
jgi:hypothetical protein